MVDIKNLLHDFNSITLQEMDGVSLLKRTDTKFVLTIDQLAELLDLVKDNYRALEINNQRLMSYQTTYYDTIHYQFFYHHHNQRKNRYKVRTRTYLNGGLSFLEVKFKNNKSQTIKSRSLIELDSFIPNGHQILLDANLDQLHLQKSLVNDFQRFTLTDKDLTERTTIDLNIAFNGSVWQKNLVILELKQPKLNRNSLVFRALKQMHVQPTSFSKYCIGLSLQDNQMKNNNFKSTFNLINKLMAS
jgi:hypothetical protein